MGRGRGVLEREANGVEYDQSTLHIWIYIPRGKCHNETHHPVQRLYTNKNIEAKTNEDYSNMLLF